MIRMVCSLVPGLRWTQLDAIQVERTFNFPSRKTKSASDPKLRVPFLSSMPRALAGCKVAASRAWTTEQPASTHTHTHKTLFIHSSLPFKWIWNTNNSFTRNKLEIFSPVIDSKHFVVYRIMMKTETKKNGLISGPCVTDTSIGAVILDKLIKRWVESG